MKKNFGFTLIELLVVIVIMGILATISTATFSSYFAKARDAKRLSSVQSMKMLIQMAGSDDWTAHRYLFQEGENEVTLGVNKKSLKTLTSLFDENDYTPPKGENSICYLIGMGSGFDEYVGDDNQFFVATWKESTNEIIVDGTKGAKALMESAGLKRDAFVCGTMVERGEDALKGVFGDNTAAGTNAQAFFIETLNLPDAATGKMLADIAP